MKSIFKTLSLMLFSIALLVGCKKDESMVSYVSATNPVLTSSIASGSSLSLTEPNAANVAMQLSWTNPNYMFSTGISSQPVNYTIEVDTTGSNFSNPNRGQIAISIDLTRTLTVADLNAYLVRDAKLKPEVAHNVEIRIVATIGTGAAPVYSNVLKYVVTPYIIAKVTLPSNGDLFIVGDATPGGWANPVPVPSQQFTKLSKTLYEITIQLSANKHYLLLPDNGSWGKKYAVNDNTLPDGWKGGEFIYSTGPGKDIQGPPADGNYKITVDFQEGTYTVVKL